MGKMRSKICPTCGEGTRNAFVAIPSKVVELLGTTHAEVCFDCAMDFEVRKCGKQVEYLKNKGGKQIGKS